MLESELPEDVEQPAREHKTLETQYGEAKLESARDLLRVMILHTGADLALRQAVALMAESGGPKVSHVTLHKKMRLAAPLLRSLITRLANRSSLPMRTQRGEKFALMKWLRIGAAAA